MPTIQSTAPIHVKVYKETRELRQELCDLGTGEWRTWTEKEEYEVVDLTEDTPVKLARSSSTHDLALTAQEEKNKKMRKMIMLLKKKKNMSE